MKEKTDWGLEDQILSYSFDQRFRHFFQMENDLVFIFFHHKCRSQWPRKRAETLNQIPCELGELSDRNFEDSKGWVRITTYFGPLWFFRINLTESYIRWKIRNFRAFWCQIRRLSCRYKRSVSSSHTKWLE